MLVFDGDYPMAHGAMDLNRDLTLTIAEARALQEGSPEPERRPSSGIMATVPEMRRGMVAVALVKVVARIHREGNPLPGYRCGDIAYAAAHAQLAYYRILEQRGEGRILKGREDVTGHIQTWLKSTDPQSLPIGFVLGMEGADPILFPEQVQEWRECGIRVISLAHYGVSTYAHGTGTPGGLLPQADPLLREMDGTGMILDLTHTSDKAFWQALDIFSGPVIASHQNCRALVPGDRQFSDEQLRAILDRGAVIGISMDTWMLYPEWNLDWGGGHPDRRSCFPREAVTVETVVDHIDHVCQLAGNSNHAAIGGDTDGQGGQEGAPFGIDTVVDYQKIGGVLEKRGYKQDDVANVMFRNWERFFARWLPGE